jgi:hypothetical protein
VGDAGHAKSEFTSFLAARETRAGGREEQKKVKHRGHGDVLVQPEVEKWRFPLASVPPFGR